MQEIKILNVNDTNYYLHDITSRSAASLVRPTLYVDAYKSVVTSTIYGYDYINLDNYDDTYREAGTCAIYDGFRTLISEISDLTDYRAAYCTTAVDMPIRIVDLIIRNMDSPEYVYLTTGFITLRNWGWTSADRLLMFPSKGYIASVYAQDDITTYPFMVFSNTSDSIF